MTDITPGPGPRPEADLETAREAWSPEWPAHLALTGFELEPEPEL